MPAKSLMDSYVYNMINKNNIISSNIIKAVSRGTRVDLKNELPESHMTISRNINNPLKMEVLKSVDDGEIELIFSPPDIKIPTSLPFILYSAGKSGKHNVVAKVFIDLYSTKSEAGYKTDTKKLYCMLEGALLALAYFKHYKSISSTPKVITAGSNIYSHMIMRVLNKKYSLIDKNKINSVLYLAAKFFILNVLQCPDDEAAHNYAMKSTKNANVIMINDIKNIVNAQTSKDLSTFILALSNNQDVLGIKGINVRGFIEAFINMYDSSAILSLELFPYFMYNILSVINTAYINNQYILEDIVLDADRSGTELYNTIKNFVD